METRLSLSRFKRTGEFSLDFTFLRAKIVRLRSKLKGKSKAFSPLIVCLHYWHVKALLLFNILISPCFCMLLIRFTSSKHHGWTGPAASAQQNLSWVDLDSVNLSFFFELILKLLWAAFPSPNAIRTQQPGVLRFLLRS